MLMALTMPIAGEAASLDGSGCASERGGEPAGCPGIRPGARMTSPALCTFNFVFTDGAALYIGTAGHCAARNDRVAAAGVGEFGTVVVDVDDGGPDDFALIRVDEAKRGLVNPRMCVFGGPSGLHPGSGSVGQVINEYGWGFATEFFEDTRQRSHLLRTSSATSVSWVGVGSGGDSGAPVVTEGGLALAIHTRGLTPLAGVIDEAGPHVRHAMALAAARGVNLSLVTA